MIKNEEVRLHRIVLCGEYATKVLEATVFERLGFLIQLRVAFWRLRWTSQVASLGADAYRVGPVECNELRAVEA